MRVLRRVTMAAVFVSTLAGCAAPSAASGSGLKGTLVLQPVPGRWSGLLRPCPVLDTALAARLRVRAPGEVRNERDGGWANATHYVNCGYPPAVGSAAPSVSLAVNIFGKAQSGTVEQAAQRQLASRRDEAALIGMALQPVLGLGDEAYVTQLPEDPQLILLLRAGSAQISVELLAQGRAPRTAAQRQRFVAAHLPAAREVAAAEIANLH